MDIIDGFDLLVKAKEQDQEEKIYQRWLNGYQTQTSYKEFKEELIKSMNPNSKKTDAEVIKEVDLILKKPKSIQKNVMK